jgi:hypothetical protein
MIEVIVYNDEYKTYWDNFIKTSRIDTFLFYRDFMEYHSYNFEDLSLMIYRKGILVAILPGNIEGNNFYSHQGLTYGGIVTSLKISARDLIEVFKGINKTLKEKGISKVFYKPTPHIYHKYPAEEDLYVLFLLNAQKTACNLSSTIYQKSKIVFNESRKSGVRKAKLNEIKISQSNNFSDFWVILSENLLDKHGKIPVHSVKEIQFLKEKFPYNIKFYGAYILDNLIGGTVLFIMENVVHVQYISASEKGKELGALDFIFDFLINIEYTDKKYFDFGHSTEQAGLILNNNLIFQKEGFGGRGIVYDTFSYNL